jgi:nucleoside-diphosphate-sugar epimerase
MRADASLPPRKIALIGATGFIGRRLAAHLTNRGDVVLALVRSRQSPHLAQLPPGILIREVRLDADNPALADALAEADAVIYAAGSVRGCGLNDFSPANVRGVAAVAGLLSARQPFVLLSSLAASQADLSPYAASKRLGERVLESADQVFPWTILRPTAVYGPGDR